MKELDELLVGYLRECWPAATQAERTRFEHILDLPDPLLAAYLLGREPAPDEESERLLDRLRRRPWSTGKDTINTAAPGA